MNQTDRYYRRKKTLSEADEHHEYFMKGLFELEKNEWDNAIDLFSEAIRLNENTMETYLMRGMAYLERQMYIDAIKDLSVAIKCNPRNHESYTFRGLAYYMLNDYARAVIDLSKAVTLNPSDDLAGSLLEKINTNTSHK